MERILNQSHHKETFFYGLSRMLERASYYGLRSLLVLYMVGESLKMDRDEAFNIYGWFIGLFVVSQVIGAILGDLIIGTRKSIIIGGIIQTIGAFSFCLPSSIGLYLGLFLVILGGGLYSPNITSSFGKLYLSKTKLLDSGFTLLYLAANLGAFWGILLIGYSGEKYGWNIGFIIAGTLMLFSIIPILISKEKNPQEKLASEQPIGKRIVNITIAFLLVAIFWAIYEISNIRFFGLQIQLSEISALNIPKSMWSSINSVFILPISLLAIILWRYLYSSQLFKLMIGFILSAISYGILFLIPETPTEQHTILYLVSIFFLCISEVHIAPIINSVLTKYTNPKYLAILISLSFIPTRLVSSIIWLFNEGQYDNPKLAILIGMIAMFIMSLGLIAYHLTHKKPLTSLTHN
ncbi:MFS transporter [Aquimarina sp. RZ0]|uniref:POT-type proton-dependent oligopeptide transporter n=1 Tax=Aquimarina sp. RZ0 TaxID=2607730 RepID=UPI0011F126A7|nr:MFS transporter [Aquimarina sp. RZ0]KAA1245786.1 peptide MFS transporter [Aquimarina sp. RZ0]